MASTIPSDAHASGDSGHITDHNNISDVLSTMTGVSPGGTVALRAQTVLLPSGDTTGTTDTNAINTAFGATPGAVVTLGAGTYYIKSDILIKGAGQQLAGQQIKGTIIQAVAGGTFTSGIIAITADRCGVHDILFQNASGTITSNPAATAIAITGSFHTFLENIEGIFINGWLVDLESTSSSTNMYMRHVIARTCAGGIKLGGPASNRAIGTLMDGCGTAQIGVSTGPFANLDALYCYRVTDITMTNCSFSVGNSTTGHGAHFLAVSNVFWTVFDIGGFPFPAPGSGQCGILIDGNGTDGNTSGVTISHGVLQTFDIGARVTGNCTNVTFEDISVGGNMTHGIKIDSGFANTSFIRGCSFGVTSGANGAGGATSYAYTATNASPAVFTATGSSFANGSTVQLTSGAPTGFTNATTYFVVNASGTTFNLSATSGGAAINSTSTGSGTLTPGPSYDLYWNSNSACRVESSEFNSGIVAVGANGVQQSIAVPAGNNTQFLNNRFTGGSSTAANQYTNRAANQAGIPLATGTTALVAGTKTVSTAVVTATTRIVLRMVAPGGTPGAQFVSAVVATTSFTITSTSGTDTSTVEWAVYP